ncbi:ABC transporter permease [Verrucomicrobiota bacterium]
MMLRIRQFFTLTGLTAIEAIRQPICLLLTASCVLLIALVPLIQLHNFGEGGKFVRDSALALHFVFGLFIVGYAASSSLAREIKKGTALTVLSKPVGRELFFLSKFFGIICLVLLFSMCASIATLLSERVAEKFYSDGRFLGWHLDGQTGIMLLTVPFAAFLTAGLINYRLKRPFESTAFGLLLMFLLLVMLIAGFFDISGQPASFDLHVQWRIVPAGILIAMALIMLSSIAMVLSTRLSTVPSLMIGTGIFMIGLMSDYLFGRNAGSSRVAAFFYRILPNWQHFWVSDALSGGGTVPGVYILSTGFYALMYIAGILCLGMLLFRHTEMK